MSARNQGLIRLQAAFYPTLDVLLWPERPHRAVARRPRRDRAPVDAGRVRGVQPLPGAAELADDRLRLGHQHRAARRRLLGTDARSAGCAEGRVPSPTLRGRSGARRRGLAARTRPDVPPAAPHRGPAPDVPLSGRGQRRAAGRVVRRRARPDRRHCRRTPGRASPRCCCCCRACTSRRAARSSLDGIDILDIPLPDAAVGDRRRAAGAVPVLRHRRRQYRVRAGRRVGAPRPTRGRVVRAAALAGLEPTSPGSITASTRWSASAASRSQAARSSGRRSRGPSPAIRGILLLDDALSAVDTATEEAILRELTAVRRVAHVPHRRASRLDRPRRRPDSGAAPTAGSSSAARTTSWWRRAASTPTCTGASSWKRRSRRLGRFRGSRFRVRVEVRVRTRRYAGRRHRQGI